MVLYNVAQRPGGIVVRSPPALHSDRFGDRDSNVVDVGPIEDRFEDRIAEAEGQNVLNAFFSQIVIDAIDLIFMKYFPECGIQFACAPEVVPKWFFKHHPHPRALRLLEHAGSIEVSDDARNKIRCDSE